MPIYMDRHVLTDATSEDLAHAHAKDLRVQGKHNVAFRTYWFDAKTGCAFCLVEAPSCDAVTAVHDEAHGLPPSEIIEVDPSVVEAFLGRISDPGSLVGRADAIDESAIRVVMFTDIVNSTDMTARLGDAGAMQLIRAHDTVVRRELGEARGREVKHLGDGIMASFSDARAAVSCAAAILRGALAFNHSSEEPLHLRIGLHVGEPVNAHNDLFGSTVQMAARICDDASVDAIVVSDDVRVLLDDSFQLTPLGKRMLKGFKDPAPLFSVDWRS